MKWLSTFYSRISGFVPLLMRVALGFIMFWHGKVKFFDTHIGKVKAFFSSQLHVPIPSVSVPLLAVLELVGGLALIAGLATRLLSSLFVIEMILALAYYKYPQHVGIIGSNQAGAELDWALLVAFLALGLLGAGRWSADHILGLDRHEDRSVVGAAAH